MNAGSANDYGVGENLNSPIANGRPAPAVVPPGIATVAVSNIRRAPSQPRVNFEPGALSELAESIKKCGLIQPLVVRPSDGGFELIAGERRWRACQIAGVVEVPVVVRELDDADAFAVALVENIQREDLNPLEEALGYRRLIDEFGYTQKSVAETVGKSRSAVANSVRLLKLPAAVQSLISSGGLSAGHARSLVGLPECDAVALARAMVDHGCSVREAEELVRQPTMTLAQAKRLRDGPEPRYRNDEAVLQLSEALSNSLGTNVKVKDRRGKGRIEIDYSDYDVLQTVLTRVFGD